MSLGLNLGSIELPLEVVWEPLLAAGVALFVSAIGMYSLVTVYSTLSPHSETGFLKPLKELKPPKLWKAAIFPPLALTIGGRLVLTKILVATSELVRADTVERINNAMTGRQIRMEGVVTDRETITAPMSRENCAVVDWKIEEQSMGRWTPVREGFEIGDFYISDGSESVLIPSCPDAEFSIASEYDVVHEIESLRETPASVQSLVQRYAPDASVKNGGPFRLVERRINPGESISVFGEFQESIRNGAWEPSIADPKSEEFRVHVSTGDVSQLHRETLRDASAGLFWGLTVLASGITFCGSVVAVLDIIVF